MINFFDEIKEYIRKNIKIIKVDDKEIVLGFENDDVFFNVHQTGKSKIPKRKFIARGRNGNAIES